MIADAIQKVLDISERIRTLNIAGRDWSSKGLVPILQSEENSPDPMVFETLMGLKEFAEGFTPPATSDIGSLFFHVVSPVEVVFCGQIQTTNFNKRFKYARAIVSQEHFQFSNRERQHWYDLEMFIISLQSLFVSNETLEHILDNAGNIINEHVIEHKDDRMAQSLLVRTGIAQRGEAKVENPVILKPWRTFREVDQPEGNFILRWRSGGDREPVKASLWDADGGKWRLDAVRNVKQWLEINTGLKSVA